MKPLFIRKKTLLIYGISSISLAAVLEKSSIIFNMPLIGSIFYLPAILQEDYAVCNNKYTQDAKNGHTSLF